MNTNIDAAPARCAFQPPEAAQWRAIARRYQGRWLQGYVLGKLCSDPVYAAVAREITAHPAPVLDVGCGIGLLAQYLHACGCPVSYRGLDIDAGKIRAARHAMASERETCFEHGSCDSLGGWQGHVVILDVLHYLDAEAQAGLLRAAAARVAPGASLIVRTVLRERSWRFAATRVEETLIRRSRWIRYGVRHYPTLETLRQVLESAGLDLGATPLFGRTPFNSYLLVARGPNESGTRRPANSVQ